MIKNIKKKLLPLLLICMSQIHAIELSDKISEYLKLNGFATIGASTLFNEGQEFRAYTFQTDGVRKGEVNLVNNTLLGVQAKVSLTDSLLATVQGLVRNDYARHYDITLDWAYLSYITDYDMTLRAGKFRLPLFSSSELTYVGYTRTGVRPDLAVYGVGGFTNLTGADLLYRTNYGETDINFQLAYGVDEQNSGDRLPGYRSFKSNNIFVSKVTAEQEMGLLSLAYFRADSNFLNINRDGHVLNDAKVLVQMISAEMELHYDDLTIEAGYAKGWVDIIQPDEILTYATMYYQLGDWRPYMIYSSKKFERKPPPIGNRPPPSGNRTLVGATPPPLNIQEEIVGIGVRYDFSNHAALKIQLDHVNGMQSDPQLLISDDQNDRKATVLTLTVDMVF